MGIVIVGVLAAIELGFALCGDVLRNKMCWSRCGVRVIIGEGCLNVAADGGR